MNRYTVQELVELLSEIKDKSKLIYIKDLANEGSYYDNSSYEFKIVEKSKVIAFCIDEID